MVTGPGEAAELLRRRKVLIPTKLMFLSRKSFLQKLVESWNARKSQRACGTLYRLTARN